MSSRVFWNLFSRASILLRGGLWSWGPVTILTWGLASRGQASNKGELVSKTDE